MLTGQRSSISWMRCCADSLPGFLRRQNSRNLRFQEQGKNSWRYMPCNRCIPTTNARIHPFAASKHDRVPAMSMKEAIPGKISLSSILWL